MERRTEIVYAHEVDDEVEEDEVEDYPVHLFLSREGYFKKILYKKRKLKLRETPGICRHRGKPM